jgi:hypothetical protein
LVVGVDHSQVARSTAWSAAVEQMERSTVEDGVEPLAEVGHLTRVVAPEAGR